MQSGRPIFNEMNALSFLLHARVFVSKFQEPPRSILPLFSQVLRNSLKFVISLQYPP
jgi:hypothetical protein